MRRRGAFEQQPSLDGAPMDRLLRRLDSVVSAHNSFMSNQLARNGVRVLHGRASFRDPHTLTVSTISGGVEVIPADLIVIATGSRPRQPPDIDIDHQHVLDSDSILSMTWLPSSLIVLGSGVVAAEYASIFATLGVRVTMVDKWATPVGFMDPDLVQGFLDAFEAAGGKFLGGTAIDTVRWDGIAEVHVNLADGTTVRADRALCALGRVANTQGLRLDQAGLELNERQLLDVDAHCRTAVPHIYAVGDVAGWPALASSAMEQGRRAMRHALGLSTGRGQDLLPVGIYTIPEMSSVGLTEAQAIKKYGGALVGRANFDEIGRGQIAGISGVLKLIAEPTGRLPVGVHILGEGAAELVHVGQMAMLGAATSRPSSRTSSTSPQWPRPTEWPPWTSSTHAPP